tara:strand:- start:517 stop:651 length:135 start_codon:yes stop_codon:yes gene_type:complete
MEKFDLIILIIILTCLSGIFISQIEDAGEEVKYRANAAARSLGI